MNEVTLNALINLFAIFSAISETSREDAVKEFKLYLSINLGISSSEQYVSLFEGLLDFYGVGDEAIFDIDLYDQALVVSQNIKSAIPKSEQVMLFLRFLEIAQNGDFDKAERLFASLAEVFGVDKGEFEKFKTFITSPSISDVDGPDFLIIDSSDSESSRKSHHIKQDKLNGALVFVSSSLFDHYIFILRGSAELHLEGNIILPNRFYAFKEGGVLRDAYASPIYFSDVNNKYLGETGVEPFLFEGDEVEFRFKNSDNGLYPFSFSEQSGQMIAVMGGSGVGKSTLLNVLNGNIPMQKGGMAINKQDFHASNVDGLIGFVPQDDLLFEDLTVWENLYFNAKLCFDKATEVEVHEKVERILRELELFAHKDLKVGSPLKKMISGGQRKRLNVALELMREPSILFVDEPTSGLSSSDSEKIMHLLKQQARKGKLVIVNIHQPSSVIFKLFDKLWVIDKGGRPIYTGNPIDAIVYFRRKVHHAGGDNCECRLCGNVNPEQVLDIIENKKIDSSGNFTDERQFSPEDWYRSYKKNIEQKPVLSDRVPKDLPHSDFSKPNLFGQLLVFLKRNFRTKIADHNYLLINLIEAPLLALLIAYFTKYAEGDQYVFSENKSLISYFFMSIVVVLFMGMSVSAEEIIKDRNILQRESFLKLSRFSYINSKLIFLLLLSAFQTLLFALVGHAMLEITDMTISFWMVLFSISVFANLLGLNISSGFDSVVTIYILIPLLLIPQILLCGVIVKFDDIQDKMADKDAVPLLGELMVSRWAFEAMAVEQYTGNEYMAYFFDIDKEMANARYRTSVLVPELMGQVELVTGWGQKDRYDALARHKIDLIRNEIQKMDAERVIDPFLPIDKLRYAAFTPDLSKQLLLHLAAYKQYYNVIYRQSQKAKEDELRRIKLAYGSDYLLETKSRCHNEALEALVLNSTSSPYFRETKNGIMQKVGPIFKPTDFNNGRAHFLAADKRFFNTLFSTYAFNLTVIWLMCLCLYLALYYDLLRKGLSFVGSFKSRF